MMITFTAAVPAAQLYTYDTYDADTNERVVQNSRRVTYRPDGKFDVVIEWTSFTDDQSGRQSYFLGPNWATLQWTSVSPAEDTNLEGRREGDRVILRGRHRGEGVETSYEIDELPLHINPALGLQFFVTSGQEKMEFWTLRPDNLNKYKMKAENKGPETVDVDGRPVEAVRVEWGLTGLKSMFFSQTMWFRATNGVFVRSDTSRGRWSQLVKQTYAP